MRKIFIVFGVVLFISIAIGCGNKNTVKQINAESLTISYGKSIYQSKDKIDQEAIKSLVKKYNNIKLVGPVNQAINYDKAITIIFNNNDQISGRITIDDKGICRIGDKQNNYITTEESNIYADALKIYQDLTPLPKKYTLNMALENNDIVWTHEDIYNLEKLNLFVENVQKKVPDMIRVVGFTKEGDPIIKDLEYDGEIIELTEDSTLDKFSSNPSINVNEYTKILIEKRYSEHYKGYFIEYLLKSNKDNNGVIIAQIFEVE